MKKKMNWTTDFVRYAGADIDHHVSLPPPLSLCRKRDVRLGIEAPGSVKGIEGLCGRALVYTRNGWAKEKMPIGRWQK